LYEFLRTHGAKFGWKTSYFTVWDDFLKNHIAMIRGVP
jgi:hypothetical protein